LKNLVALKVLIWSRGRLVTLQILTSFSISLVEETHSSLGQCVSFSLIDIGSGSTTYVVFLFFFYLLFYWQVTSRGGIVSASHWFNSKGEGTKSEVSLAANYYARKVRRHIWEGRMANV